METFKVTKEDLRQEPVPPGFYKALINEAKFKMSSTGKPMIVVEYTLQSQSNETKMKTIGRKIFENLVITMDSLWRANNVVNAATGRDIPEKTYTQEELVQTIIAAVKGKAVLVKVETRTYEGALQNEIKEVKKSA